MLRNPEWKKHAIEKISRIKEFREMSPMGYYSSPDEYMDTLEDFGKLFYEINRMPEEVAVQFISTRNAFEIFKNKLNFLCEDLLKKVNEK